VSFDEVFFAMGVKTTTVYFSHAICLIFLSRRE
jgi:hypothetical protein